MVRTFGLVAIGMIGMAACSATKRSQAVYRQDTQAVLETRRDRITTCYDKALETDPKITGLVTVRFIVEKKTGTFRSATVDPTKSNATEALVVCVLEAVKGLALNPPDTNEGQATFVYEFKPGPA